MTIQVLEKFQKSRLGRTSLQNFLTQNRNRRKLLQRMFNNCNVQHIMMSVELIAIYVTFLRQREQLAGGKGRRMTGGMKRVN